MRARSGGDAALEAPASRPTALGLSALVGVTNACTACGACLLTCPEGALMPASRRPVVTARCTACGECIEICPRGALVELPNIR